MKTIFTKEQAATNVAEFKQEETNRHLRTLETLHNHYWFIAELFAEIEYQSVQGKESAEFKYLSENKIPVIVMEQLTESLSWIGYEVTMSGKWDIYFIGTIEISWRN